MAPHADAFAHCAHIRRAIQFQVNDAPLARRHRIKAEVLSCLTNALRSNARRKLQFFEAQSARILAIEPNLIGHARLKTQPSMRQIFDCEKQLALLGEQKLAVISVERNLDAGSIRPILGLIDLVIEIQLRRTKNQIEKSAQVLATFISFDVLILRHLFSYWLRVPQQVKVSFRAHGLARGICFSDALQNSRFLIA